MMLNTSRWIGIGGYDHNSPRTLLDAMVNGLGYRQLYNDIILPDLKAGCREFWWYHPGGCTPAYDSEKNQWWAKMEWDQLNLAQEDLSVPIRVCYAAWIDVANLVANYSRSVQQMVYVGSTHLSDTMTKMAQFNDKTMVNRGNDLVNAIIAIPRMGMCVDSLIETRKTNTIHYNYLRSVQTRLKSYNRRFAGEEAGDVWYLGDWQDVQVGLTSWSQIQTGRKGPVPDGKIGYAYDDGRDPQEMITVCKQKGWTPLVGFPTPVR